MAYTRVTLKQQNQIREYITPLLEKVTDGYYRYKDGQTEVGIAAQLTRELDFPVSPSNVAHVREALFGKLRVYRTPVIEQPHTLEYRVDRLEKRLLELVRALEQSNVIKRRANKCQSS
jgi:hypothetical protein